MGLPVGRKATEPTALVIGVNCFARESVCPCIRLPVNQFTREPLAYEYFLPLNNIEIRMLDMLSKIKRDEDIINHSNYINCYDKYSFTGTAGKSSL
jgi:hypothetical protein